MSDLDKKPDKEVPAVPPADADPVTADDSAAGSDVPADGAEAVDDLNAGDESDLAAYGLDGIDLDEEAEKADEADEAPEPEKDETPETAEKADDEAETTTAEAEDPDTEAAEPDDTTTEPVAEAAKPAGNTKEFRAKVNETALARFKQETGEEFDEFNRDHQLTLATIAAEVVSEVKEIAREMQRQQAVIADSQQKIKTILPSDEMRKFADDLFDGQTRKEAKRIEDALGRGDFGPMLEFCQKAAKEFNARKTGGKKVEEIKKRNVPPPPVLEGAGGRGTGGTADDGMDQLAGFGLG